ncbi:MAG: YybS family protein [Spirochaetales bacterium]|nr:YybS family protein [Spirochaetales bacterium]
MSGKNSALVETLIFSAGAVIFFELSVFIVIFVIPLAVLYRRRGFYAGLAGCGITAAGIAGTRLYQMLGASSGALRYDLLGIALVVPLSFLLGLSILEAPPFRRMRIWQRLVFAALGAAIVYLPLLYRLVNSEEFDMMLRSQVEAIIQTVQGAQSGATMLPLVSAEEIVRMSRTVFLNTFLPGYMFTLAANWVIGVKMAMRMNGAVGEFPPYRTFRLPDKAVYVFLVSWAVVFAAFLRDFGIAGTAAWNCALVVSLLYMCQGVGIIKTRTEGAPRGFRLLVMLLCFTLVFTVGLVFIFGIMAGVALLGVSELWINYRNKVRS